MSVTRVLVANRGEIAVRVIRACQSLGIETVAAVSDADRESMAAQMANRAVCIGPARSTDSYLKIENLIAAAQGTGCDALHPGYGFLSERAALAQACARKQYYLHRPERREYHYDGRQARSAQNRSRRRRAVGAGIRSREESARSCAARRTDRLSALAQGFRRRRRPRHQAGLQRQRDRRYLPHRRGGSASGIRQRHALHGTICRQRASYRSADPRRPASAM